MSFPSTQTRLSDYIAVVSTRRWLAGSVLAVALLAAAVYLFVTTPVYRAEALVLIEPSKVNLTEFKGVYDPNIQIGGEFGRREFYETQYRLLVNRSLMERTFHEFGLSQHERFSNRDDPVADFRKLFAVRPVRRSRLVTVTFDWEDPELAARVLSYLVEEYIVDYRNRALGVTTTGLSALRNKAGELRPLMESKAAALEDFVENTDMVSLEKTENVIIDRLKEISTSLSEVERKRIEYESIYTNIEQALSEDRDIEDMPEMHLSPAIRDLKLEYVRTKQDFSELVKRFGPRHPEVVASIARLKTIADKLEQEVRSTRETMTAQLDRTRNQEEDLRRELTAQEQKVLKLNRMAARYNILKDSYDTQKKTYQALVKRIEEIEVTMAAGSRDDNIFVITEPRVPVRPVKPKKAVTVLLAAMMGLLGGVGLCFVVDYLDTTVKGKKDVERLLDVPLLGYVPGIKGIGRGAFGLKKRGSELIILDQERSVAAEAFRSIRTALLFSGSGGMPGTLQVTSSLPKEGKTLVSVNIAAALAKTGKKVLLIDADMRKPRLHRVFALPAGRGLSTLLTGGGPISFEGLLRPVAGLTGLDCLLSGPLPPNPAELLGGVRMRELLDAAQKEYDMVVLDTPPVINVTDPVVISRIVQGTILVVRTFSTESDLARRSMDLLEQARATILGVVLNNLDMPSSGYYSYDGHYYQHQKYYYGDYGSKKAGRRQGTGGTSA